ncbi:hypothetical protein HYALB_00008776 [Hymenoscyphus albidus]|uniref:Uncharacterized protein n=1 Tax=Hymenoscyphus albidus TaxID=595503 RepID=A0A9N9QBF2_9HELO|nr:hypothetical protein HYALB_00008776 [Hymenoscyphus albidus]
MGCNVRITEWDSAKKDFYHNWALKMQILKLMGTALILSDFVVARAWVFRPRKSNEHNTYAPEDDPSLKHRGRIMARSTSLFSGDSLPRTKIFEDHGALMLSAEQNAKQVDFITNYGHYKIHQISQPYPDGQIPERLIYAVTKDIAKIMLRFFEFVPSGGIMKPAETRQEKRGYREVTDVGRRPNFAYDTKRVEYANHPEQHGEHSYEPKDHGEYESHPEPVYDPKSHGQYEYHPEQHEYEPQSQGGYEYQPEPVYDQHKQGKYDHYPEQQEYYPQNHEEYEHRPEHIYEPKDYGDHPYEQVQHGDYAYDPQYHGDYSVDNHGHAHDDNTDQTLVDGINSNVTQSGISQNSGFPYDIVYQLLNNTLGNEMAHEISLRVMEMTIKSQPNNSTTTTTVVTTDVGNQTTTAVVTDAGADALDETTPDTTA